MGNYTTEDSPNNLQKRDMSDKEDMVCRDPECPRFYFTHKEHIGIEGIPAMTRTPYVDYD